MNREEKQIILNFLMIKDLHLKLTPIMREIAWKYFESIKDMKDLCEYTMRYLNWCPRRYILAENTNKMIVEFMKNCVKYKLIGNSNNIGWEIIIN